ncbi:ATP-binding protein [Brevundimonas sp. LF-1]|uniref:ATP-binding protein n=1 Tax=Brevundimonas sp. LF-1 TaxID=3126100 RepID=UPI0030DE8A76
MQKDVALTLELDPDLDAAFIGDAVRLRQVLTNLVSNAVKFTETGQVRLEARRAAEGRALFVVSDTGIGFDEEFKQRIFHRFQQADGSITRRFGGSGLGLAISADLVRLMGGRLDCDRRRMEARGSGSNCLCRLRLRLRSRLLPPPRDPSRAMSA